MRVKATVRGFFGKLREPGDVFDVPDDTKIRPSGTWFKPAPAAPISEADQAELDAAAEDAAALAVYIPSPASEEPQIA